ncbi:MAG: glycosyltransferase [Polaromonas sp.]|uniref:glycosyltransferase n=1 Tax=Polaromonas sp. TaxID=1869339 RepID=UPI0040372767
MDLPAASAPAPALHLVGCFDDPHAGAERELLDLAAALAPLRPVMLWSVLPPHPWYAQRGVRPVQAFSGQFPQGGVLVWGGAHVAPGLWLRYARFERIIVQCNLASWQRLFTLIDVFRDTAHREPELVFVSRSLQLTAGLPGRVVPSPMVIQPFLQAGRARGVRSGPLTVGRVSRDTPDKHHPQDPLLYRMLAARGWRVRILGGTCLAAELAGVPGVELLPAGAEDTLDFYRSLDIFFYRTGTTVEAYGRVIVEAMASGLPVVAGSHGGYTDIMLPGQTGVLVDSQEAAWDALTGLESDAALRLAMGQAAMHQAEQVHGQAALRAALAAYLS